MDDVRERRCLIALHLTPALGAVRIARLVRALGSAASVWEAPEPALARVAGIGPRLAALIVSGRRRADVDGELHRAAVRGVRVLTWLDEGYPAPLRELRDAPPVVYVRGAWAVGSPARASACGSGESGTPPAVAVVGTRRASAYGLGIAEALGEVLGGAGVVVVSGLARGVDRAAHGGALRAGGVTVGVVGCGVDVVYPADHRSLMEAMQHRGGVASELPMGTPPRAQQFPPRNRLISGLAQAVVVVEGDVDSGAVITARYAAAQGRQVFAVPGSVHARVSRGPHRLLAQGARILGRPEDLLEALGLQGRSRGHPRTGALPGAEARIMGVLEDQMLHIDAVAARAGLSAAEAAGALCALEVRGLVRRLPGHYYARRTTAGYGQDNAPSRGQAGGAAWPNHSSL